MVFDTVISAATLWQHHADPGWVIVDCRFQLADTNAGRQAYCVAHIPGAVYADLNRDLSNPPHTDHGRHPLPPPAVIAQRFGAIGIGNNTQVIAYDDNGGAIAARLWWMLRYMGHDKAAVLDGGWTAWLEAELPTESGWRAPDATTFAGAPQSERLVTLADVPSAAQLVDARDPVRYRGDEEPIDPVAGHIPGAVNHPYHRNLAPSGRFLPPDEVAAQLAAATGSIPSSDVVFYCGSGVTACLNLLAQAYAGLPLGRLYVGSWSEWSADATRPVARGDSKSEG
jgi:thiosulfate/3-mercaptopyruvate sulfurtransferase